MVIKEEAAQNIELPRVIVVCPYAEINEHFQKFIPTLLESDISIRNAANLRGRPYINVEEEEGDKRRPILIIDFQRTIAEIERRRIIVPVYRYRTFFNEKCGQEETAYLAPKKERMAELDGAATA